MFALERGVSDVCLGIYQNEPTFPPPKHTFYSLTRRNSKTLDILLSWCGVGVSETLEGFWVISDAITLHIHVRFLKKYTFRAYFEATRGTVLYLPWGIPSVPCELRISFLFPICQGRSKETARRVLRWRINLVYYISKLVRGLWLVNS